MNKRVKIELLAPARDAATAMEAIRHGADAVYMGASDFGARAAASNDVADVARVAEFAHQYNARVYATVNTLLYNDELWRAERLVADLWQAGVDALIVQDMALLRLDVPPIELHASTQCDIRTPEKARFLEQVGFSQLVLARELTLDEISAIRAAVKVPIEAFVHGALCVCYSGRCGLSQAVKSRSANRGECAQMCRLSFDLVDGNGRVLERGKHLLSLRDLNQTRNLEAMLEAGVSSFKIEGRLKEPGYVKNVVAHYRRAFDRIIADHPDRYSRASAGTSTFTFTPDPVKSFNRSFTTYFLTNRQPANGSTMASTATPKSLGEPIGKVKSVRGLDVTVDTGTALANGDGLSYFDSDGQFQGVRVNQAAEGRVVLRERVALPAGTMMYRTFDKRFTDLLSADSARRVITLDARLRYLPEQGRLLIDLTDERGCRVTHGVDIGPLDKAEKSQAERQTDLLGRLGDTIYVLREAEVLPEWFIPASVLARLRREAVETLSRLRLTTWPVSRRRAEDPSARYPSPRLEAADNVANEVAGRFYRDHGVTEIAPALEVSRRVTPEVPLMTTRYCLRRELGICLLTPRGKAVPAPLTLLHGPDRFRLDFDCRRCEMWLTKAE